MNLPNSTMFHHWDMLKNKTIAEKTMLRNAMSQTWLHFTNLCLAKNSKRIGELDESNRQAAPETGGDNSHQFIKKIVVADALFSLYFKERFLNKFLNHDVDAEKVEWMNLVQEEASVHGYKRFRDGQRFCVTGYMTRIHPVSMKSFSSYFSLPTTSLESAHNILNSLDLHNNVKSASIISKATHQTVGTWPIPATSRSFNDANKQTTSVKETNWPYFR